MRLRCRRFPLGTIAIGSLFLVSLGWPRPAGAWGLYGHVAIGDAAARELGLPEQERAWFVLGSLMGDLDKSDHLQGAVGPHGAAGSLLRMLARLGNGYRFDPVVDQHDARYAAALIERAHAGGDRRLLAWSYGVMCHGLSDRFTDHYPDPRYRVSTSLAEVSADMVIFGRRAERRYARLLRTIERNDEILVGIAPQLPPSWTVRNIVRELKGGAQLDAAVRAADPFAALVLETHRRVFGTPGPALTVSDIARQQIAFDAFVWNYRHKAWFMPGWRRFARRKGAAWYDRVEHIALEELRDEIVRTVRAWQAHFDALAAGLPSRRPAIP